MAEKKNKNIKEGEKMNFLPSRNREPEPSRTSKIIYRLCICIACIHSVVRAFRGWRIISSSLEIDKLWWK